MSTLIYFLLLLLFTAYWYFTRKQTYWKERNILGPKPLPFFGNLLEIVFTSRAALELNLYKRYGNVYGYFLLNRPVLVMGELEYVKKVLVKDFNIFPNRRGTDTSHPIMQKNLAQVEGADWKRIRSITSPTFSSSKMKMMYPLIDECFNNFSVHLDDLAKRKSNVNIKDIYGSLTLNMIALTAFATNLNSQNELDNIFLKHARNSFQINPIKTILVRTLPAFVFKVFGVRPDRNSDESQDFYLDLAQQIVDKRRKSGQKFNDYLQLLIDADKSIEKNYAVDVGESRHVNEGKEELQADKEVFDDAFKNSNKKLDESEIIAQIVTFLMAGYETTATALTYITYELALNTDVQDKLFDEVKAALNDSGNIDYDVLCRLPYLDAVISETLRRHPPVIKTNRIALQEYQLKNIKLYPGQMVDIPIYAIHHDEKYYADPFTFNPDRFMPHNRHNLVPYTYMPFGGGPRNCVGFRFALLELKLTLAHVVQRYTFFKCNETDVPLIPDLKARLNVPKRAIVGIEMRTN